MQKITFCTPMYTVLFSSYYSNLYLFGITVAFSNAVSIYTLFKQCMLYKNNEQRMNVQALFNDCGNCSDCN